MDHLSLIRAATRTLVDHVDELTELDSAIGDGDHGLNMKRGALAIVTVSTDQAHADRELAAAADEIERVEPGLITRTEVEFLT